MRRAEGQTAKRAALPPGPGMACAGRDSRSVSSQCSLAWGCCQPIVGGGCVVVVDSDGWEAVSCKDLEPSAPQHF